MKNQVFAASLWSVFAEIIAKIIGPLGFLILTKILSPADFGVVAVATTILGFVMIISDLGIGKVLIQERYNNQLSLEINNIGFWINAFLGTILFALMFLFSSQLAVFFGNKNSDLVIKVMSIQVLLTAFSSVQIAIKKRELNFKFLFITRLITVTIPFLISVPIALSGGGYWAIVIGQISGTALNTLVLWINSKWRPSFHFKIYDFKNIILKSCWNTLDQLFIWIPLGFDTYLISKYLTSDDLGRYSTSRSLFSALISLTIGAVMPVMFSVYSRVKSNSKFLKKTLLFYQKIIFSISTFIGVGVYIYRDFIEKVLFNENWNGISEIFGLIFLIMGFTYFSGVMVEGLRAKGFFRITAINTTITSLLSLPCLYFSITYGLYFYVLVRMSLLFFGDIFIFYFAKKKLNISIFECLMNTKNIFFCVISLLVSSALISEIYLDKFILNLIYMLLIVMHVTLLGFLEKKNLVKFKNLFSGLMKVKSN